jgi:Cytokine-induced anti-apoptosis inhibitor 1, Fe-S biogenesis
MTKTVLFLELTANGVAENENYSAVTILSAALAANGGDGGGEAQKEYVTELHIRIGDASLFQPLELSKFVPLLAEHAKVMFDVAIIDIPKVQMACILSGLSVFSERVSNGTDRRVVITAKKPPRSSSRSVQTRPLLLNTTSATTNNDYSSNNNNNNNHNHNGTVLIDEDDLLQEEGDWAPDTTKTTTTEAENDCSGRAPCDNCTCGRKEGNDNNPLASATSNQAPLSSNCGKCGMGDAFRCSLCPFLGKPAFKAGQEHLVLDLQDDL